MRWPSRSTPLYKKQQLERLAIAIKRYKNIAFLFISEKRLHLTDFTDDRPLTHKGSRWFARRVIESMKLI